MAGNGREAEQLPRKRRRLVVYLTNEQYEKLEALKQKYLDIPYTSIVSHALDIWLSKEPEFRALPKPNGKSRQLEK
jgi:hypothetical protein